MIIISYNIFLLRDDKIIDNTFLMITSIYLKARIFLYSVHSLKQYTIPNDLRDIGRQIISCCNPETRPGNDIFLLIHHGEVPNNRYYQSVFPKRNARKLNNQVTSSFVINKDAVKRWVSDTGVKRKSNSISTLINDALKTFLNQIIHDALDQRNNNKRCYISPQDIVNAIAQSNYFSKYKKKMMKDLVGRRKMAVTNVQRTKSCQQDIRIKSKT